MHGYSLKNKNLDVLNFRLCVYTICLILLPFKLLTSLTEIAYAKSATEAAKESPRGSFLKELDNNNLRQTQAGNRAASLCKFIAAETCS